jgi:transposase
MSDVKLSGLMPTVPETVPKSTSLGEVSMVREDCWRQVHRLFHLEGRSKAEIARQLELDRKTIRGILREPAWRAYARPERTDTLLTEHAPYLRERAPQVQYSARILWQELRRARQYRGSYETVKRFVQPLRAAERAADRATVRFETPPGLQSQVDWGQARIYFGHRPVTLHVFVLTLGYSRRSFFEPSLGETLSQFLDAHERAFDYFGGHTREHLYDRPRTVCAPAGAGRVVWNVTFKQFADYWGFEPHLCRAYRAQTKGNVESGVKYFKRGFLPGRAFRDEVDLREQLGQWQTEVADVRIHGTTHERPGERFQREQPQLIATAGQPGFRLEASQPRIVATDYLISFEANRYSVPFTLVGQTVEVARRGNHLEICHRGTRVAAHELLPGKYHVRILPEHGPGAIARTVRRVRSTPIGGGGRPALLDVEVRDLALYDALLGDTDIAAPLVRGAVAPNAAPDLPVAAVFA